MKKYNDTQLIVMLENTMYQKACRNYRNTYSPFSQGPSETMYNVSSSDSHFLQWNIHSLLYVFPSEPQTGLRSQGQKHSWKHFGGFSKQKIN